MTVVNKTIILGLMQKKYGVLAANTVQIRRKADRQVWRVTASNHDVFALKYLQKSDSAGKIAAVNDYLHGKGIPVAGEQKSHPFDEFAAAPLLCWFVWRGSRRSSHGNHVFSGMRAGVGRDL